MILFGCDCSNEDKYAKGKDEVIEFVKVHKHPIICIKYAEGRNENDGYRVANYTLVSKDGSMISSGFIDMYLPDTIK